MNMVKEFFDAKERANISLEEAFDNKKVDEGILPVLTLLNASEEYYTSSSCAGRIVLLELPKIGNKKQAEFLGRWHRTITNDELLTAVKTAKKGLLWLLAQSPILHIGARSLEAADTLVKLANGSGFKNSSIKSIKKNIIVEISSTERLDALIGNDGVLLCDTKYLTLLLEISNQVIEKSGEKLQRFEKNLRNL